MMIFLEALGLLALTAAAIAWWRGWFSFSAGRGAPWSRKYKLGLTVDPGKAEKDGQSLKAAAADLKN